MYYKVKKDNKVIDILDKVIFLKYQSKHDIMVICDESEAQAIMSSDKKYIWHVEGMYKIPKDGFDTVQLEEIDFYEYNKLKAFNMSTPEECIEEFVLGLLKEGIL